MGSPVTEVLQLPRLVGQGEADSSHVDLFRYGEGIIDLDAEISDGTFDLSVAKQ
jgi:hypothetical protein